MERINANPNRPAKEVVLLLTLRWPTQPSAPMGSPQAERFQVVRATLDAHLQQRRFLDGVFGVPIQFLPVGRDHHENVVITGKSAIAVVPCRERETAVGPDPPSGLNPRLSLGIENDMTILGRPAVNKQNLPLDGIGGVGRQLPVGFAITTPQSAKTNHPRHQPSNANHQALVSLQGEQNT